MTRRSSFLRVLVKVACPFVLLLALFGACGNDSQTAGKQGKSEKDTRDASSTSGPDEAATEVVRMGELEGTAILVGGAPDTMGLGFGSVWVRDGAEDRVSRIDADTNRVLAVIPVDPGGGFGRFGFGHGSVWVTNIDTGTVSRIDPKSNRVEETISTGRKGINYVAVTRDAVWAGRGGDDRGHVVRIDPATNEVTVEIPLPHRDLGGGVGALIPVGDEVWTYVPERVIRIDSGSNRVVGDIAVKDACGNSVARNGSRVWTEGCFTGLVGIDAATHRVSRVPTEVQAPFVASTDHAVWATDKFGQLLRVDPRRGRVVDTFELSPVEGPEADAPTMVSDRRRLWIADFPRGRIVRIDEPALPG